MIKKLLLPLAFATISTSSFADGVDYKPKLEDWSFGISGGTNTFGHLNRNGHSIEQKPSLFVKASADKRLCPEYSLGVSLTQQLGGKVKDSYESGDRTHTVEMKYKTTAVLLSGKYFFEDSSEFEPYINGSLGVSINSPKDEIHNDGSVTSTFHKKSTYIQPAAGIGAGVSWSVSDSQKMFVDYQLLYSGKMKTSGTVTTGGVTTNEKLSNNLFQNIVTIGFEFKI